MKVKHNITSCDEAAKTLRDMGIKVNRAYHHPIKDTAYPRPAVIVYFADHNGDEVGYWIVMSQDLIVFSKPRKVATEFLFNAEEIPLIPLSR